MEKRIALVTGANKGLGFAIAHQLGLGGHGVWLGCRDQARGEAAADRLREIGIDARVVRLDVTDPESVASAVAEVGAATDRIDVLVNNAGTHFGPPPPAGEEPIDQIRAIFETNVFGVLSVTQAFLPMLRRSASARIVMMSSGLGSKTETLDMRSENWSVGFAGYCASKAALNMLTVKLAKELDIDGIKVNAADPGLTSTDLTGNGPGHSPDDGARAAVALATTHAHGPTAGFYRCDERGDLRLQPW
ncbi:short-chain dehydrogenase [Aureimonas altamirensis]|uniref:Short-chain dehydrogenase n=1 Tax=Aureimonas altamirensis TaxID=370622 RepID=A0A0B1PYL9_9HYPH|nr:SDR family oxidoreductase [Aureimonas altamirensis]KHJ53608.1 short-chain dehydrogenase [Aureimonas altamirensis]